jgi:predicted dithiol-disulfide oxidoreductase (DUF899 family)
MGWTFPWASPFGSDFNFDFKLSFTGEEPIRFVDRTLRREAVSDRESAKGSRRLGFGENRESHGDVPKRSCPTGLQNSRAWDQSDQRSMTATCC